MSVKCTSCNHLIPDGQFRCGKCGAAAPDIEADDLAGLGEIAENKDSSPPRVSQARDQADEASPPDTTSDGAAAPPPAVPAATEVSEPVAAATAVTDSRPPSTTQDAPTQAGGEPGQANTGGGAVEAPEPSAAPTGDSRGAEEAPPKEDRPKPAEDAPSVAPKGAFGGDDSAGSDGEATETKARDGEPEAAREDVVVERPPGWEPTRLSGASDAEEEPEAGPKPAKATEADASMRTEAAPATPEAETAEPEAAEAGDDEPSLELDVPAGGIRSLPRRPMPPFLASKIMQEDLTPAEPGKQLLVQLCRVLGVLGAVACAAISGAQTTALVAAAACAGLAAVGFMPMSYLSRAATVTAAACVASAMPWERVAVGAPNDAPMLTLTASLLAGALWFRAWYRNSGVARILVGIGLISTAGWAALASGDSQLLTLSWDWQSWLPALMWYLFVLIWLLALLAFMGPETTGACEVWAPLLLVWFAVQNLVRFAVVSFPAGAPLEPTAIDRNFAAMSLAEPAFVAAGAAALAQLFTVLLGRRAAQPHPA